MKVLITGGAGFIGSHLVDAYLRRGDAVAIVDDLSSGNQNNIKSALALGAKLFEISVQSQELKTVFEEARPDLLSHHAAQKSVRDSVLHPVKDAEINLGGLLNVLEAARSVNCRKVLFASSGGVIYGEQESFPAREDHPKRPVSPYGIAKWASEVYLEYYKYQWNFDVVCLRYGNVYGPRQDPDGEAGVVAIFAKKMIEGAPTVLYGHGKPTRDFIYVEDVVQANLAVEKMLKGFKVYNVAKGEEVDIEGIHRILSEVSQYKMNAKMEKARPGEQKRSWLSTHLIQSVIGWEPKVSLQDGLKQTFQWFFKNK